MKIEILQQNPYNFNVMGKEEFELLKQDIKKRKTLDQKIVVRPLTEGKYEIINGYHRVKALKELGYKEIPDEWIEIVDVDNRVALEQLFSGNIRGKRHPIKYARFLKKYMEEKKLNQSQLSEELGIDKTRLSRTLTVLNIKSEYVQKQIEELGDPLIESGDLTSKHLELLSRFNHSLEIQELIWSDYILLKRLSVNQILRNLREAGRKEEYVTRLIPIPKDVDRYYVDLCHRRGLDLNDLLVAIMARRLQYAEDDDAFVRAVSGWIELHAKR